MVVIVGRFTSLGKMLSRLESGQPFIFRQPTIERNSRLSILIWLDFSPSRDSRSEFAFKSPLLVGH